MIDTKSLLAERQEILTKGIKERLIESTRKQKAIKERNRLKEEEQERIEQEIREELAKIKQRKTLEIWIPDPKDYHAVVINSKNTQRAVQQQARRRNRERTILPPILFSRKGDSITLKEREPRPGNSRRAKSSHVTSPRGRIFAPKLENQRAILPRTNSDSSV